MPLQQPASLPAAQPAGQLLCLLCLLCERDLLLLLLLRGRLLCLLCERELQLLLLRGRLR